jgi:hypothetical protein
VGEMAALDPLLTHPQEAGVKGEVITGGAFLRRYPCRLPVREAVRVWWTRLCAVFRIWSVYC